MKPLLIVILMVGCFSLMAQNTLLRGLVVDASLQPVPLAHVSINKQVFTAADINGYFVLKTKELKPTDSITVSAMGFVVHTIALNHYTPGDTLRIALEADTYWLDGVTINNYKARSHWLKALQKLQAHRPSIAYTYPALFRQTHIENGAYVRLIEAGMTVYDVAASYQTGAMQERFSMQQVRRSNVLERNGDQHGDHLVDMFMENSLRYPTGTILDPRIIDQFELVFDDGNCTICGDSLEQLVYRYQNAGDPKLLEGKIWLYTGSMRLFGLEETALNNPHYVQRGITLSGGDHHWMFQESKKTLWFQYTAGKVYLEQLQFVYLHHIQDRQVGMVRYTITESFSLYCGMPTAKNEGFVPDRTFARSGNLYSRKYEYEEAYWKQFPLALKHPLPEDVAQTMSSKTPLSEQFKKNGE